MARFTTSRSRPAEHPRRISTVAVVIAALAVVLVWSVPVAAAQARPPVDGVVVDGFRPPAHIGAPGNRGWEYATVPGSPVRAALGGVVAFAGPVAGNLFVSIDHPGGLRSTYSFLADITVRQGQVVAPGAHLGITTATFHFGIRRDRTYLDPAMLFDAVAGGPPRLVPRPGRVPARVHAIVGLGGASAPIPLHSRLGPIPDQQTSSPWATHGRRVSGVGPGIR